VDDWRRDSDSIWEGMSEQVVNAGLGEFPGATGFGGIFNDPDGIEIQFLPSPSTLVTAAVPSDLAKHNAGPVTPLGVDHMVLNVSNLERALDYYHILYGTESTRSETQATFVFPRSNTRLILQEISYTYANAPGIVSFGIKTRPFDQALVSRHLTSLGATILPNRDPAALLRFSDPDGIIVELNPV